MINIIEKWKENKVKKQGTIKEIFIEKSTSEYYSQAKKYNHAETEYIKYIKKNILPYNE